MTWRKGTLLDLVLLQRGFDITKAQQKPGDIPVVSSSGIKSFHSEAKVAGPGIIIGRKGTLGSVHYSVGDYWPHDTTLWSKNLNGNDPRFVYYFLQTLHLENYNVGNANPTLNRNHNHKLDIEIPPIKSQAQIAEVLSKYDDLIENNLRRITLLEQSARLLYEEWFVRLRFPGYENTKIRDGVPEGWEKERLGDAVMLNYGKALRADLREDGIVPVYGSSGVVGVHNIALAKGPGIIIGRKGNVGSVYWSHRDFYPIDTVYYVASDSSDYYLYHNLKNQNFLSSDAAVPGLNRKFAYSPPFLRPSDRVSHKFNSVVSPIYEQARVLEFQNQKLKQARDLLLPRLMNGEIAV